MNKKLLLKPFIFLIFSLLSLKSNAALPVEQFPIETFAQANPFLEGMREGEQIRQQELATREAILRMQIEEQALRNAQLENERLQAEIRQQKSKNK